MTDEALLQLWHQDKDRALEVLVRTYQKPLYHFLRHILHTHEDTDDVLQEVFIKLWKKLGTFKGQSRLSTFIYQVAYNEAISYLRKQKLRYKLTHPFSDFESWYLERIQDEPTIDAEGAYRALLKHVALLPPRQKAVFSLRYFDNLSFKEIAQRLGMAESTARATYHQVVQKLKQHLPQLNESSSRTSHLVKGKDNVSGP